MCFFFCKTTKFTSSALFCVFWFSVFALWDEGPNVRLCRSVFCRLACVHCWMTLFLFLWHDSVVGVLRLSLSVTFVAFWGDGHVSVYQALFLCAATVAAVVVASWCVLCAVSKPSFFLIEKMTWFFHRQKRRFFFVCALFFLYHTGSVHVLLLWWPAHTAYI